MELQDAVNAARKFADQALADEHPGRLSVEEIEYDSAQEIWKITFGYKRRLPAKELDPITRLTGAGFVRPGVVEYETVYKLIHVPADGNMPSMKIRQL